ncbi:hypothetical protein [Paenibacillus sp. Soil522]|uniref:hypothetical protein n=1 Tax=Paenibacillus sp. Soil522 TaxID=1736388 RepID=UPI0006FA6EBF|nr:hypothetical protein [Paenibacillus sp. Soil522]KRE46782.1 hypothetical protein ASG81_10995 [Paenibacillus sp. Soil522]
MNAIRLTIPKEKVQQLQEKLGHAAKENKKRKFHALYDKIEPLNMASLLIVERSLTAWQTVKIILKEVEITV